MIVFYSIAIYIILILLYLQKTFSFGRCDLKSKKSDFIKVKEMDNRKYKWILFIINNFYNIWTAKIKIKIKKIL